MSASGIAHGFRALLFSLVVQAALAQSQPVPPQPERNPHVREIHGRKLVDDYFWLRERDNPRVLEHLRAENAYAAAVTAHLKPLEDQLYAEFLSRIQQSDLSVPALDNGYYYYSRTVEGQNYPLYCRRKGSPNGPEEVILDVNQLAEGRPTLFAFPLDVSPDNRVLAYAEDLTGGRRYTLRFKELDTGKLLPDTVEDAAADFAWFNDSRTYAYNVVDHAVRSYKCVQRSLGQPAEAASVIHEESDERFWLSLGRSRSDAYVFLVSSSMKSAEWRYADAGDPARGFRMIAARMPDVEYSVEHHGDSFYILHNDGAVNFALVQAPVSSPGREQWRPVLAESPDRYLLDVDAFRNYLVLSTRENGLPAIRILGLPEGPEHTIEFPEAAYSVGLSANYEFDTSVLRYGYSSMVTPASVFDYDMGTRQRTLLKEQPVPGGYDRSRYKTERIHATAADGAQIPIALAYRVDRKRAGAQPLVLDGYGAYGIPSDADFDSNMISLLDRGVICAIAQVRGGAERGRRWYEAGRLRHKANTFTDFIAAARHLVQQGYTASDRLAIRGGSAGGLLVGAVLNLEPELCCAAMAQVPFVDVINTMLDDDLPLTVTEYEQWGDPHEPGDFEYMLRYSPYDNVGAKPYPAVLATAGFHDSQVCYWEPAKWIARLRDHSTGSQPLLFKVNLEAAHGGASGRYDQLRESAFRMAWLLDQLGAK